MATHSVVSATLGGYKCEAQGNTRDCLSEWVKIGRNEKVRRLGKRESYQAFLIHSLAKAASQNVQTKLIHYQRYPHSTNFARLPQIQHKKNATKKHASHHLHFFDSWLPIFFSSSTLPPNAKPVGPLSEDASPGPARCGVVEIRRSIDLWDHLYFFRKLCQEVGVLKNRYSICDWSWCSWCF